MLRNRRRMNPSSVRHYHPTLNHFRKQESVNARAPRLYPFQPPRCKEQLFREKTRKQYVRTFDEMQSLFLVFTLQNLKVRRNTPNLLNKDSWQIERNQNFHLFHPCHPHQNLSKHTFSQTWTKQRYLNVANSSNSRILHISTVLRMRDPQLISKKDYRRARKGF